jgi:hypothetical protein
VTNQGQGQRVSPFLVCARRAYRQAAAVASLLATRLRLTPGSKLDTRTPTDGELPVG